MKVTPGSVVVGFLDPGIWSACFGLSYRDLVLADALGPKRIIRKGGMELRKIAGSGAIASGRNEVVLKFLDSTDGEWLWMVDTDMGFAADVVERLMKAADPVAKPVVGGLAFCLRGDGHGPLYSERFMIAPTLYSYADTGDEIGFRNVAAYPVDEVVPVSGTGAACLLMHRGALETVRKQQGEIWFNPITHPTGDHGRPRTFSEDLSFCVRLAKANIPVHVDTSAKTTHHKGGIFLDEETYDRQQNAAAMEAAVVDQVDALPDAVPQI